MKYLCFPFLSKSKAYPWILICYGILFCTLMWGCAPMGTAQVQGNLQAAQCSAIQQSTAWALPSSSLTYLYMGDQKQPAVAELRIQAYPGSPTHPNPAAQDRLLIEIYQPLQIQINQSIPIVKYEARVAAQSPNNDTTRPSARATLDLGKTCPTHSQPFLLEGTLTFTQFGWKPGDTLAGTLQLQLFPARAAPATDQGNLQGNFSFPWHPPMELGHDFVGYRPSP